MTERKCIVPNCTNVATAGIPFPKQKEVQEKWLESLEITEFVPISTSFVCLRHFGREDSTKLNDVDLEEALEELPIPVCTVLQPKCHTDEKPTTVKETLDDSPVCRLCMSEDEVTESIFNKIYENITIAKAICQCIPEITITKFDKRSKFICKRCKEKVQSYLNFKNSCIAVDKKMNATLRRPLKRKPKENSEHEIVTSKKVKTDKKFDHVKVELMKALEGKLTDEMKDADNIIIEVQSDEESEVSSHTNKPSIVSLSDSNISVQVGDTAIKLPKGIKISVNSSQAASNTNTAESSSKIISGHQRSEYCLVDNYLYEFGLSKGSIRHIKCIEEKCKAVGILKNVDSNNVVIKIPHNHPAPTEKEMKKSMFMHTICRKMQSNTNLNFRNVYDEMCDQYPDMKKLIQLRTVIKSICSSQMQKSPVVVSFQDFCDTIEEDCFQKLHFTHTNKQFYQETITTSDGSQCVIFANCDTIAELSDSKIMYVDASFKIETNESFDYQLVTILVWVTDSFYPILFALVSVKSQEIYREIFSYLHDTLAPQLRPEEIVTDYEAALYYSLGETYLDSHIGGSVFYYTQNIYKKICSLNLARKLETDCCFRNIYHMILMLPLLPVNTILDGLNNIELQAAELNLTEITAPIFEYVKNEWMEKVTPDLFCVHRLENRINENVIAPFKKLRDFIMLSKGKMQKQQSTIVYVVEKLIELEGFLQATYSAPSKKSFARDLSSSQKKNVVRAWQYIESHPKININCFFNKVLGYIKCMENQLWIWGFYGYAGDATNDLINAANFSIINTSEDEEGETVVGICEEEQPLIASTSSANYDHADYVYPAQSGDTEMDLVIEQTAADEFLVRRRTEQGESKEVEDLQESEANEIESFVTTEN